MSFLYTFNAMKKYIIYVCVCLFNVCATHILQAQSDIALPIQAPKKAPVVSFVQNKNQWSREVQYRADIPSGFLFLKQNSLIYSFYDALRIDELRHGHTEGHAHTEYLYKDSDRETIKAAAFEVEFVGANDSPNLLPEQPGTMPRNYFLGNDPSKYASNVPSFGKMTYQNIYPNTDLRIFLKEDHLKYELELKAGTDPEQIRMRYKGAEKIELINGDLHILTAVHRVIEQKPYCYQVIDGKEVQVPSKFILKNNTLSFDFPEGFNKNYNLVIDPVLVFSTFSGSFADNWGITATYDSKSNLYSGGTVFGSGFPTTIGAFDVSFNDNIDIGIMKYNPTGTAALYATYIGGNSVEGPHSLIADDTDDLFIMGTTSSNNYPTSAGAYDASFSGGIPLTDLFGGGSYGYPNGSDIFISKLNPSGSTLLASTFVGGARNDGLNQLGEALTKNYGDQMRGDLAFDAAGNVYVASVTRSPDFPIVSAAFPSYGGSQQDAVVFKLNPTLNTMIWSTFYGGNGLDAAHSIKLNSAGKVYITGGTNSNNLPSTSGVYQFLYQGGIDAFVARFSADGAYEVGTYVGTSSYNQAYLMDIDEAGSVYLFGQTQGTYPVIGAVYSNPNSGQFIHKLSPNLVSTSFSTTIGTGRSTPDISPTSFLVNSCNQIYLSGWGGVTNNRPVYMGLSTTTGLPVGGGPIKSTTTGNDFYLMILSSNASSFLYGSFFGEDGPRGEHVDGGTSRFDRKTGSIYHAVCACGGSGFPTTPGAWSRTNNSTNCNNAAFKIDFDSLKAAFNTRDVNGVVGVTDGCAPLRLRFDNLSVGATSYEWTFDTISVSTDVTGIWVTFETAGVYQIRLIARNPILCKSRDTAFMTIKVIEANFKVNGPFKICQGQSVKLKASGGGKYLWKPDSTLSCSTCAEPTATPPVTTTYLVSIEAANGCKKDTSILVEVLPPLKPNFKVKLENPCDTVTKVTIINESEGVKNYIWTGPFGTSTLANPPPFTVSGVGEYTIKLVVSNENCRDSITKKFSIFKNNIRLPRDTVICKGQRVKLSAGGGSAYSWSPGKSLSDSTIAEPIASPTETTVYTLTIKGKGDCVKIVPIKVTVLPLAKADFDIELDGICDSLPTVRLINKSEGTKFLWRFGDGRTSTLKDPPPFSYAKAGRYVISLVVEQSGACGDSLAKPLEIFLNGFNVSPDTTICFGESARLFASGGSAYVWSPAESLNNPNIPNPIAKPNMTTIYKVTIDGKNGCKFDTSVTVTVLPEVKADFEVKLSGGCDKLPLVEIKNKSTGAKTYFWDFGNGKTSTAENPPPFNYTAEGTYTIILKANNGRCSDTAGQKLVIRIDKLSNILKGLKVPNDTLVCVGSGVQLFATGGQNYRWTPSTGLSNPNIPNPIATPSTTTRYTVTISNEGGCSVDTSLTVRVVPDIALDFVVQASSDCGKPSTVSFENKSQGADEYIWIMGNGDTLRGVKPSPYTYKAAGKYKVSLLGKNGVCDKTASVELLIDNVLPPNVITPNGDGKNDFFEIDKVTTGWKVKIYDRWEKLVFESDDYQNDWGKDTQATTYYYLLTSPEGRTCRGWIQVLR